MKRVSVRIGLRLLLLLVALCCVMAAVSRSLLDVRRERIRAELMSLEFQQERLEKTIEYEFPLNPKTMAELKRVNALLAEKQQQIRDTRNFTKDARRRIFQYHLDWTMMNRERVMNELASETNPDTKVRQQWHLVQLDAQISRLRSQINDLKY
jgi:hypothetical protein